MTSCPIVFMRIYSDPPNVITVVSKDATHFYGMRSMMAGEYAKPLKTYRFRMSLLPLQKREHPQSLKRSVSTEE